MVRHLVMPAHQISDHELCTVDVAAAVLHVHRKTVLRFIHDGRLPASKIGKSYRIRRVDLDVFAGVPSVVVAPADTARVTAIVDVAAVGSALASKLAGAVTNALHSGRDQRGDVHAEVVYDADRLHLKIVVVGSVTDTSDLLALLHVWLEQMTP